MDVNIDDKGFITKIKEESSEESNKCDVRFEEMEVNAGDFLEQELIIKQEINIHSAENNEIIDPLENIQVKNDPELCLEDQVPLENNHVKNENKICLVEIPLENIQVKNECEIYLEDPVSCIPIISSHLDDKDAYNNQKDSTKDLYTCDVCDKGFTLSIKLKVHKRKNACKKLYKCEACPSSYSSNSDLLAHILTHIPSGIQGTSKQFTCGECFKEFAELHSFKVHMGLHTGYKPYKCDTCDAAFVRNSHLTTHKLIHLKKKEHKCDLCTKKFFQLSNLKQHQRTHTGIKPFQCNFCDKQFGHNKNLKQHTRTYHMDSLQLAPFQ